MTNRYEINTQNNKIIDILTEEEYSTKETVDLLNEQQVKIIRQYRVIKDFHNREIAEKEYGANRPVFCVDRYYRIALTDGKNLDELENLLNLCDDYNIPLDSIYDMVEEYIEMITKE